jgi:drug/metabolite transporter (DMT)-like permease
MLKLDFSHKPTQWVVLVLLALTWGSSFILMKKGLIYFDSNEVAAFRISMAFLVLLPIALRNLKTLKGNYLPLLVTGLFGNAIPAFLFALAQTQIPSALSGILNSLTSLFTLLIGVAIFRTKTTWMQVTGVLIALIGAAGLIGFESLFAFSGNSKYALLVVCGALMYGIAVNTIKSKLPHLKPTHITSLSFLLTGPWCLVYLIFGTSFMDKVATNPESWIGVLYLSILAIVGTAIAVIIFNKLIKETTAVFATTVTYLIPVVALGWGLLDGELIQLTDLVFMLFILLGIFLINMKSPGKWLNKMFR